MEDGALRATLAGTPQGGVISPLLANIYLNVLDRVWVSRCSHLGTLVRYADDFVVLCRREVQAKEALRRVRVIMDRLGLELHPDKTRMVNMAAERKALSFSDGTCESDAVSSAIRVGISYSDGRPRKR